MARPQAPVRKSANLTVEQMRSATTKIERRVDDLRQLDINSIRKRFDPVVDVLETKINSTLQDALGDDTVEYNEYKVRLDTLPLFMRGEPTPIHELHAGYREGVERAILKLQTLVGLFHERIDDANESPEQVTASSKTKTFTRRVFVVHGHDDGLKETVARYISALDLTPVVLHEQPNQGRTIIEKFEHHADVDFAVVLFTPDDIGHAVGKEADARPRARQNVVLELGFFMAALSRHRVCVLHSGNVELPSDYAGVLYLPIDGAGAWRFLLAKEMKASGMDIDLNLVG